MSIPRLLVAVLLVLGPWSGARAQEPLVVRVLSYNIRHGEGRDDRVDLERIARVIEEARPDLVALQEVDRGTERVEGADQLAELARRLGMHAAFGRAMEFEGGEYGVAVLSRWPLEEARNVPLPSSPHREPRTALTVRLRLGAAGPWISFTSTHLDSGRDSDRAEQAVYLNELLVTEGAASSILAGDLNARPDDDVLRTFAGSWSRAEADDPPGARRRGPRGDHVLFRPDGRWRVLEATLIDEVMASDHRPVLVVLEHVDGEEPAGR